jgi:hypothetical protein
MYQISPKLKNAKKHWCKFVYVHMEGVAVTVLIFTKPVVANKYLWTSCAAQTASVV